MESKIKIQILFSVIIVAFVLVAGVFLFSSPFKAPPKESVLPYALILETRKASESSQEPKINLFSALTFEAKSAYVFDLKNKKAIFALNEKDQLPLASLTKLMVALLASEVLSKDAVIKIPEEAILQEGDEGLRAGENWRVSELIDFMLISSSNDAAFAIVRELENDLNGSGSNDFSKIAELMNKRASELMMEGTYFINSTGLDISKNISGGYGSSQDIAKLVEYILLNAPSLLDATSQMSISVLSFEGTTYLVNNTNKIVNLVPGLIASKTGFTDLAGGNLMVVFDLGFNHPIISVVLGSSFEGRFSDMLKLVEATFKHYSQ